MTLTLAVTKNEKGDRECTVEYEKYGCLQAFVYEKVGDDYNWIIIHKSQPTHDEEKVMSAYKRFVKKYL